MPLLQDVDVKRVGCRGSCFEGLRRRRLERLLVQISVIVANIQTNYIVALQGKPKCGGRHVKL